MSRGINRVTLIGNLGRDPEIRNMPNGKSVANFSIATSESWTDKQSGEKVEKVEWHNCVAFERLAEIIGEYVHKGSQVYVEGQLRTRKWQDKEGKDRYTTEIVCREMQMLGGKRGDSQAAQAHAGESTSQGSGGSDMSDDIPFASHEAGTIA